MFPKITEWTPRENPLIGGARPPHSSAPGRGAFILQVPLHLIYIGQSISNLKDKHELLQYLEHLQNYRVFIYVIAIPIMAACIFCRIIKGEIPSFKLFESDKTLAFLDIGPLSKGHALVIPKFHGAKLTDIPDDHLAEILPVAKKLVTATGATDYNILQNNGRIAHQIVDHVHFHMIPKPNEKEGLGVGWPTQQPDMEELKKYFEEVKSKM
ncbi:hypothetical protein NPX13_g1788 [Xylaria arbuscula]|uniref:Adenosine 5'-monophosphoramidase HNT1 n=1 Tax=Xylaria arbuscula TaxID=114810 RepID=A0A9W8NKD4_9PEZI|nr:hypothetical protein NPX13_g1788 [Xylaria arbuscula]